METVLLEISKMWSAILEIEVYKKNRDPIVVSSQYRYIFYAICHLQLGPLSCGIRTALLTMLYSGRRLYKYKEDDFPIQRRRLLIQRRRLLIQRRRLLIQRRRLSISKKTTINTKNKTFYYKKDDFPFYVLT